MRNTDDTLRAIRREAHVFDRDDQLDAALAMVGDAHTVLLGEATHGSAEFYRLRAGITQRLITEHGFDAVAVEADWPAALRVSRHVQGQGEDASATQALADFERFPRWMWRNTEALAFIDWLREHNAGRPASARIGFFGLDLYSLRESMQAVLRYLDAVDAPAAARARARYACFDDMARDPQVYGHATSFGLRDDCEREVVAQLVDMLRRHGDVLARQPAPDSDEHFYASLNALVVRNAETYYRAMFSGHASSWNVRDDHMAQTLQALRDHLGRQRGRPARVVVWAHNSHIGDARATEARLRGELNLGQLVRQQESRPGQTRLIGFTTHTGTVAAASDWDAPVEFKKVRDARPDSVERLLHDSGFSRFVLPLSDACGASQTLQTLLARSRLERAIGVIYRPDTERLSHYFEASLPRQFDAVIHIDRTEALTPLDASPGQGRTPEPEAWPSGL